MIRSVSFEHFSVGSGRDFVSAAYARFVHFSWPLPEPSVSSVVFNPQFDNNRAFANSLIGAVRHCRSSCEQLTGLLLVN